MKAMNYTEAIEFVMQQGCKFHHKASDRGYISVKTDGVIEEYSGIFGRGYIIRRANLRCPLDGGHYSNRYHAVEYYTI